MLLRRIFEFFSFKEIKAMFINHGAMILPLL